MSFTEANFENAVLELIQSLGYTYRYGPDIPRDYHNPRCEAGHLPAQQKNNPKKPAAAATAAGNR
nr:hypothetical protein [Methanocorpusculum sp.]